MTDAPMTPEEQAIEMLAERGRLPGASVPFDVVAELLTKALSREEQVRAEERGRYRHVKRGTIYQVVGEASLQIATYDLVDGSNLVIYRGEDGKLWAREHGEFHDGRFELAPPSLRALGHEGGGNG